MGVEVTLARDARIHHELYPDTDLSVVLHGRITNAYRRSNKVRFFTVRDVSESIQILLDRSTVEEVVWNAFEGLEIGVGVEVRGRVGRSNNGKISVFPTHAPVRLAPLGLRELLADEYSGVGTQMLLSRLENRCRRYLETQGYIELTARYLSSSWPEGGLQALNVIFPGQSRVPFFLAVSPVPQLLRAILAVGQSDFFTISRTFATNFIATQNGAESVMAGAILLGKSVDDASDVALPLVKELLLHYETGMEPELREEWEVPHTVSVSSSLDRVEARAGLHIHFARGLQGIRGPGDFPVTDAFQIHWRDELVLSEGYSMGLGRGLFATTLVLYIERFLPLLRAQDNRRIRDLVHPGTHEEQHSDSPAGSEEN
ncbi:OB-fold nucleic acid binding domain-containing protein [Kribbella sp. NPDC056861]|uniref:OB-fold nucleic acid binding domain-containing protein n=1 Tax=Kribbella sp. NPDC056861 TaxID=3154857 RepID=UPI0034298D50